MALQYPKIALLLSFSWLLTLCPTASSLADGEKYFTNNHINGIFWNNLDNTEKIHYLYGLVDGVSLIAKAKPVFDEAHNYSPKVTEGILGSAGRFFVPTGTYDDIVAFLDHLYSNEGNLKTPVYVEYAMYLADKKGWAALDKWDETLSALKVGSSSAGR